MHQSTPSGSVYANRAEKGQGEEHTGAKGKLLPGESSASSAGLPLLLLSFLALWLLHSRLCNKPVSTVMRNVSLLWMFGKVEGGSGTADWHLFCLVMSCGYFALYAYTPKWKSSILSAVGFFFGTDFPFACNLSKAFYFPGEWMHLMSWNRKGWQRFSPMNLLCFTVWLLTSPIELTSFLDRHSETPMNCSFGLWVI